MFFDEKVMLLDKAVKNAIIADIMWHYIKNQHYYHVKIDGKKQSKRYFEPQLEAGKELL